MNESEKKIKGIGPKWNYISGYVNDSGDVVGSDEVRQHEGPDGLYRYIPSQFGIHRNDAKWRCHFDDKIVRWYENPTQIQKHCVEEFLKHQYNINVYKHTLYGYSSPEDFNKNIIKEIKGMVTEGIKKHFDVRGE